MTDTKHSPLPWAVKPKETIGYADIVDGNANLVGCVSSSFPSDAEFITLACNSHYANQETIAAQAKRIDRLERPIGNDELKAALREVYQEDSEHNGIFDGMMKFALESALKIRIGDGT